MWEIPVKAKQSKDKCIRKCTERVLFFFSFLQKKEKTEESYIL